MAEFAAVHRRALIGRRRSLVTPEGVDLQLRLAEGGQRAAAFFIDLMIMALLLLVLTIGAGLIIAAFGLQGVEPGAIIWLLGFFLLRNFYFIALEMGPRAATWGKRAIGLRVVARSGERLTGDRVIARNLMREIEFYLPLTFLGYNAAQGSGDAPTALIGFLWTLIFLLFPWFNRDRLRIGDLLAGTWVVHAPRRKLAASDLPPPPEDFIHHFSDQQLDVYGIYELQTLEEVLRTANIRSIGAVADTIRRKIGADHPGSDREFLQAYYDATRARMERGLLFGRRREDKYDSGEKRD